MKMAKKGILTYHHVVNWGSVLQAVCLTKLLQKVYPADSIEIIDCVPQTSLQYNESRLYRYKRKFKFRYREKIKKFDAKMQQCQNFLHKHATISTGKLYSDDLVEIERFLEQQNYDTVFVGSDTVFQLGPNYGNKYISAPQAPNMYFLPFDSPFRKIGFAVSANPFHTSMLDRLDKKKTENALNDFEYIFYRDKVTHNALQLLNVDEKKLHYIPDPSLLVDFDLLCKEEPQGFEAEKMVAVAIGNIALANQMIEVLKKLNYTPVNLLSGSEQKGVLTTENITSVEAFINLHKKFHLVVTDRFHGSIITLVMGNCPVIGIEEVERYPDPNSKVRDLYERLGIDDMIIRYDNQPITEEFMLNIISKWKWTKIDIMKAIVKLRQEAFTTVGLL